MRRNWIRRAVKIALIGVLAVTLFTFVVMNLWNWLVPAIFGWQSVNFWQALGLLLLSRILFGGFYDSSLQYTGAETVQVAGKIEQVDFQRWSATLRDSGARAKARDTLPRLGTKTHYFDYEDPR